MELCQIAMGGNVGDVKETFPRALEMLSLGPQISVVRVSGFYRTAAIGGQAGEPFLNAAATLATDLEPLAVLDRMQKVELSLGRIRGAHWGPRSLDLDLILWGERVVNEARLQVPHPAAWYRRFVLDPLSEIAGDVMHPVKHRTISQLRARLMSRPLEVGFSGSGFARCRALASQMQAEFPSVSCRVWKKPTGEQTEAEPALIFWLGQAIEEIPCFEELPEIPRLDVSQAAGQQNEFIRDVLRSALDEPVLCG